MIGRTGGRVKYNARRGKRLLHPRPAWRYNAGRAPVAQARDRSDETRERMDGRDDGKRESRLLFGLAVLLCAGVAVYAHRQGSGASPNGGEPSPTVAPPPVSAPPPAEDPYGHLPVVTSGV